MSRSTRGWTFLLIVGLVVLTACSRSPEAKKARYLERGDKYVAHEQYREAILEYRNVLRLDPNDARANRQLGLSYYQLGELGQAFPYLLKTEKLAPDALDVRLKLGTIYLRGGKADEARREVTFVLEKEPKNLDALALLAGLAATPEAVDAAIQRLETAKADLGDRARLHLSLGFLYLRKQDVAGAERAFQEAVAKEPKSVEAHLALGDFYLGKRDATQAEREFKAAADLAPVGSVARMRFADFYLLTKAAEAKRILSEITKGAPDISPPGGGWPRSSSRRASTTKASRISKFCSRKSSDREGISCSGACARQGENTEAIQEFQQVLKLDPGMPRRATSLHWPSSRPGTSSRPRPN